MRHRTSVFSVPFAIVTLLFSFSPVSANNTVTIPAEVNLPFRYPFSVDGTLEEVGTMEHSSSPYWWMSAGGYLKLEDGIGHTVLGSAEGTKWQELYASNDPLSTDLGLHPQNIFRLVLRTKWQDIAQSMTFKVKGTVKSASLNRNASNGLQLMSRYVDQDNLYYAGLRVDGQAVIKKKYQGRYYTLDRAKIIPGVYDKLTNPNLLPIDTEIGIKTVTRNLTGGRVAIDLYTDVGGTGTWTLAASAIDDAVSFGGPALTAAGHTGIRTDFMDVEFDDYTLTAP